MRNELGTRAGGLLLAMVVGLTASSARAQAPRDPVTAEALFLDGKRLMQAKDYANACPKLAESQRLDPSGGTIFALALCYEGAGMFATAWATFNDALSEAKRAQRPDREAAAAEHVHALESKLTRLRIDVPHPVPDLEVTRNGAPVGKVVWGTPVPIDPGNYTFEARAPGKVPWKWSVNIDRPGGTFNFPVPELANAPTAPVVPVGVTPIGATGPTGPIAPVVAPPPAKAEKKSYVLPEVGFGVAAGALVVGGVIGLVASSEWSSAKSATGPSRVSMGQTAGTEADASTGLFVVGGLLAVASGIGVLVIHSSDGSNDARPARTSLHVAPTFGPGAFGLSLGGSL